MVAMMSGVTLARGTTTQESEKKTMSPSHHGLQGDAAIDFADAQRIGRGLGDFVAALGKEGVDMRHVWGGSGCHIVSAVYSSMITRSGGDVFPAIYRNLQLNILQIAKICQGENSACFQGDRSFATKHSAARNEKDPRKRQ